MRRAVLVSLSVAMFSSSEAMAKTDGYFVYMYGSDPDGSATGSILLDDVTGVISWDIAYFNLGPLTAMDIHTGTEQTVGPVLIPLASWDPGPGGELGFLEDSIVWPTVSDITSVFNDPTGYYLSLKTTEFPDGAVRDQLGVIPEPSSWLLAVAGLPAVVWLASRRCHFLCGR